MASKWPRASGEMADRIRAFDGSRRSLGPPERWPQALKTVTELMLAARHPAYIGWGPDLVIFYNDAMIPVLGGKHPALGMPYREVFAEIWEEFAPLITATLRGEAQTFEDRPMPLAAREGQPLSWFTFSFTPIRNDAGDIAGFYSGAHETSQRVRESLATQQSDKAARRASEARYRALFNSMDEGFCVIEMAFDDADKPTDYRFLETNPAFEQQTGLTHAVGKWMRTLVPLHEQNWFDTYGRVARTGEPIRFVEHSRALGRWFNVFAFRAGTRQRNQVAIIFSDITERIEAENALRLADRRKDEFLATLAHELRNPLAPLRNGLEIARRATRGDEKVQPTIAMMDRQLRHLVRLVDDLLDVGRISSGKLELRREPLTLGKVLADSVEASRVEVEQRRHELVMLGEASHLAVLGDSHRLKQVFTNLLSNACKYTEPQGRIRIEVSRQGGEAVVRVIDSGIGIPAADVPRVFELFSQVRSHQPLHSGGLGIGLSLVRSLVHLHGGSVEASSGGPGQGSTFTVRLPLLNEKPAVMEGIRPTPSASTPRRVLIADDNVDSANTLAEILRLQGHEVFTANDGVEAVEQTHAQNPDAILLDLGMPRLDGIEAARRIRAMPRGGEPFIVALTGWGQISDRERTQAAGFDCHLVKPADPAEVIHLIERGREDAARRPAPRP